MNSTSDRFYQKKSIWGRTKEQCVCKHLLRSHKAGDQLDFKAFLFSQCFGFISQFLCFQLHTQVGVSFYGQKPSDDFRFASVKTQTLPIIITRYHH